MSTVTHGLILTVVGMSLVFASLGIFLLSMIVLQRVFPATALASAEETAPELVIQDKQMEKVAAIGVALSIWQREGAEIKNPQLGSNLAAGPSFWSIRRWLARNVETFPFE